MKMRWLLALLLVLLTGSWAMAQTAAPLGGVLQPVRNQGFEQTTADGKGFADWAFNISREARVSVAVDPHGGRGHTAAPVFHNESALAANVYGRFVQGVPVLPGTRYRLSCWVKGEQVAESNHWTDWQTYMLLLPSGDFDWTRVETEFQTGPDQRGLDLGLNLVNLATRLWVDDLQLVPESGMTSVGGGGRVMLCCAGSLVVEKQALACRVLWEDVTVPGARARLEVRSGDSVVGAADLEIAGASGQADSQIKVSPGPRREGQVLLTLTDPSGRQLARVARSVDLLSDQYARQRLAAAERQLGVLRERMATWEARGLPLDYPRVTETVAANFVPWIGEDLDHGEVARALQQLDELDGVLRQAIAQCDNPPPLEALRVPRYTGGPITIAGGHFASEVAWPDGRRETRPVFFNGYGHFLAIRRDIEKLPAYGLNIIQIELGPNGVVNPDLSVNLGAVHDFLAILDRAQRSGVAVNLLLSPHYMPAWVFQRWPQVGGADGGFIRYDVDAPETRRVLETFLRAVIPLLKDQPALHSLCLSNEPIYLSAGGSAHNREQWHAWLAARHGLIERLNERWGSQYKSFDDVPVGVPGDLQPSAALHDWVSFNNARFAGWHRWMADMIHEIAPTIPVHAKIMNLPFDRNTVGWGNDPEAFCDLSQIAGNDCGNYYDHDERSFSANGWLGENRYYDLLRSMRGQPSFNSENHVIPDRDWRPEPGAHMRNLVWQGAIHGQGASTVWVWERTYDNNSDFAGSIMHRPAFCDAHGRAALDLMRLAPEVVALQDHPARVALVYSICSQVWNERYAAAVGAAYQALTFLGEKVDFVTAGQLAQGAALRYQAVILPGVTHLERTAYAALKEFSRLPGRRLLALGEGCLRADEYDRAHHNRGVKLVTVPTAPAGGDLRAALVAALGLDMPVQVLDAHTGQRAGGVEWRWARDGDRWLVNVCNYTRRPVRLRLQCRGAKQLTNLLTGQPMGSTFELGMLEPVLIEAR
jgi:hypothetical protein